MSNKMRAAVAAQIVAGLAAGCASTSGERPCKRIAWRSTLTGHTGSGECLSFDPEPLIEQLDAKFPGIKHWVEEGKR